MFDLLKDTFRTLKVYLLGKGILTLGVFAAAGIASAMGVGMLIPAMAVGIGGALLTTADRLYQQKLYETDMVDLYRNDLAQQLGKAPEDVTRADLKEAAKENDVIAQALRRQRQRSILSIGTAILSGAVSIGLIVGFGLDSQKLQNLANGTLWDALKPIANFISIGTVGGLTGLILHNGLGDAIGYGTGIHKAAAHDLITMLDSRIKRGLPVAREEVYAVIVAANPSLEQGIVREYGKSYHVMTRAQKEVVMHDARLAQPIDDIARAISDHRIHAGYLAFAANDPRLATLPKATPLHVEEVQQKPGRFVELLGLSPREATSHTARIAQERAEASAAQLG